MPCGISSRSTSGQPRCDDAVRRKSDKGIVNNHNKQDSRLPSFSQPSKMSDGQISDTRKPSHLGLYASKTIGGLRPAR